MLDTQRYQRAKSIFFHACEQPREDRDAFVDRACDGDADLLAAVRQLLAHDDDPLSMINAGRMREHLVQLAESSASDKTNGEGAGSAQGLAPPARIGRYRVLSRLGAGGMGVVYLAVQENPRRQVALKVIAPGQASRQALRRFEHEAQILGRLHHPGIAQVYEAGMHDAGEGAQPYFAMELVRGSPLLAHCAQVNADRRARLELFIAICEAVQHAHQHGVIHRDLKPANILVDAADASKPGNPSPKILDFGVARLTDSDVQATTMHTSADQLIGTVAYMSPEQMSGKADAIDTRSDVYALGVILFELLAGRLPHEVVGKSIPEMIRTISDGEPMTLSSIDRTYRGDLETIAGKAMERDKTRRYQSAGELADDVRRYLNDEPIHARPPSAAYQMRKFARRNKALVGGVAAVFVALIGGMITTTWQARQAIAARDKQIQLRKEADDNAALATASAAKATAAVGFLQELLSSADPHASKGRDYTVRQLLDDFANENVEALASQPDVHATVLETVGMAYLSLGELKAAEPHLREAVELRRQLAGRTAWGVTPALANALMDWGMLQHAMGEFVGAEAAIREAQSIYLRHADQQGQAMFAQASLGDMLLHQGKITEAIDMLEPALAWQREHGEPASVRSTANYLSSAYRAAGRRVEAIALLRSLLDESRQSGKKPSISDAVWMSNLGLVLMEVGTYQESRQLLEQALQLGREQLGEDHPEVAKRWNNLGMLHDELDEAEDAQSCFRRAIDIHRRHPEYDRGNLANMLQNLGVSLMNAHRYDEAEKALHESITIDEDLSKSKPVDLSERRGIYGELLANEGRIDEAESFTTQSFDDLRHRLGERHPSVILAKSRVGEFYLGLGRLDEAAPLLEDVYAERMKLGVPGQRDTVGAAITLARLRLGQHRPQEAADILAPILPEAIKTLGLTHSITLHALDWQINTLAMLDRWPEADALVRLKIDAMRTLRGDDSLEVADWLAMLGFSLHEQNNWAGSESVLRESRDILLKIHGPATLQARVTWRLGAAVATRERYDEAEQLLLEGFEGIRDNAEVSVNEKLQASDWLATLYRRWNKPERAAQWKATRESIMQASSPNAGG